MIASKKQNTSAPFPKAKITHVVKSILPQGNFEIRVADSKIGKMKIVRVITPAWKNLRPPERIGKVLAAMNGKLSEEEQEGILRFSVLTPEEYDTVVLNKPAQTSAGRTGRRVAKRKSVAKPKVRNLAKSVTVE